MDTNKYINSVLKPLEIDAKSFVNSLHSHFANNKLIDKNLIIALEEVVETILQFIESKPKPIVLPENKKKLVIKDKTKRKERRRRVKEKKDIPKFVTNDKNNRDTKNEISALPKKARKLLSTGFQHFFNTEPETALDLKSMPEYNEIENDLFAAIHKVFPKSTIKIFMFGSRISGTATINSDLDIYADVGETFGYFENQGSVETVKKLRKVLLELTRRKENWQDIESIERARVPILKVIHKKTKIKCDIGFSNSLGTYNTILIEYFFELQPIMRHMILLLKKWLMRTNIQFTSYTLVLMVFHFMQINQFLPSIKSLQDNLKEKKLIGPWIVNLEKKSVEELNIIQYDANETNVLSLIKLFFYIYGDFNFKTNAICPYLGESIAISRIEKAMPERYHIFKNATKSGELQINRAIVVQDPFQLNHNVAKGITSGNLKDLVTYFKASLNI